MKSGKPAFHEDYLGDGADPLGTDFVDFDWPAIERAFNEVTAESDRDAVTKFVTSIFQWVTDIDIDSKHAQTIAGRRLLALAWVVNPNLFDGVSAAKLASRLGIKSKSHFHRLTGEASRKFGIKNRGQRHAWNNSGGKNAIG